MFRAHVASIGALLIAVFSLGGCASGKVAESGPAMGLGVPAAPPAAFLDYCTRLPGECGVDPVQADARQVVARRYWKAVFAATDPHLKGGRIDWAGVAQSIDEAPAAISAESEPMPRQHAMTPDQFLNTHGGSELVSAVRQAAMGSRAPAAAGPALRKMIWDAQSRRRVEAINQAVNAAIIEQPDIVTYGLEDYWAIPTLVGKDRFGDCEDYALMKRRDLIAAGVAPDALTIAIVRTQSNSMHAVLLIATDRGDFVLDNLDGAIRAWTETSYHWVERQVPGSSFAWVRAGVPAPPQASAAVSLVAMAGSAPRVSTLALQATSLHAMYWGELTRTGGGHRRGALTAQP